MHPKKSLSRSAAAYTFGVFALVAILLTAGIAVARLRHDEPAGPSTRSGYTATALADGRVLIVGGERDGEATARAEVFDPASGQRSRVADAAFARVDHTATLLADGRVLVAGGRNGSTLLDSAEIFDPQTNSFSFAGRLSAPRAGHVSVLLQDGTVMIAGGDLSGSIDLFDGASFRAAGPRLAIPRSGASAVLLGDGRVLVAGGRTDAGRAMDVAEVVDLARGTVDRFEMNAGRVSPVFNVLPDGKVQVIGGDTDRTMEIFSGRHFTALTVLRVLDPGTIAGTMARFAFPSSDPAIERATANTRYVLQESRGRAIAADSKMRAVRVGPNGTWVTTDKPDYMPGETVVVTGGGFAPGETVSLLFERNPETTPATTLTAVADANGNFTNSQYVCVPTDLKVTFTLTARGQTSGLVAVTSFTDAAITVNVSQLTNTLQYGAIGSTATFSIQSVHQAGLHAGHAITYTMSGGGCPAGATCAFSPNPATVGAVAVDEGRSTLTITYASTALGGGNFSFKVSASDGTDAEVGESNPATNVTVAEASPNLNVSTASGPYGGSASATVTSALPSGRTITFTFSDGAGPTSSCNGTTDGSGNAGCTADLWIDPCAPSAAAGCTNSDLQVGVYPTGVTASYNGAADPNFTSGSNSDQLTVSQASTVLNVAPKSATYGDGHLAYPVVTVSATLTYTRGANTAYPLPNANTVTFSVGADGVTNSPACVDTTLSAGTASCNVDLYSPNKLKAGVWLAGSATDGVNAVYAGGGNFAGTSDKDTLTINKATPQAVLTGSPVLYNYQDDLVHTYNQGIGASVGSLWVAGVHSEILVVRGSTNSAQITAIKYRGASNDACVSEYSDWEDSAYPTVATAAGNTPAPTLQPGPAGQYVVAVSTTFADSPGAPNNGDLNSTNYNNLAYTGSCTTVGCTDPDKAGIFDIQPAPHEVIGPLFDFPLSNKTYGDTDFQVAAKHAYDYPAQQDVKTNELLSWRTWDTPGAVVYARLTSGGAGYTSAPTVSIAGTGTGAKGFATVSGGQVISVTITEGGSGYSLGGGTTINLLGGGGAGANAVAEVGAEDVTGTVISARLRNPGAGYSSAPTVSISDAAGPDPDGSGATAYANINADGQVESIVITNPGSGYDPAFTTVTLTGGGFTTLAEAVALVGTQPRPSRHCSIIYDAVPPAGESRPTLNTTTGETSAWVRIDHAEPYVTIGGTIVRGQCHVESFLYDPCDYVGLASVEREFAIEPVLPKFEWPPIETALKAGDQLVGVTNPTTAFGQIRAGIGLPDAGDPPHLDALAYFNLRGTDTEILGNYAYYPTAGTSMSQGYSQQLSVQFSPSNIDRPGFYDFYIPNLFQNTVNVDASTGGGTDPPADPPANPPALPVDTVNYCETYHYASLSPRDVELNTTIAANTVSSLVANTFLPTDVGAFITGPGIPAGASIVTYTDDQNVVISTLATGTFAATPGTKNGTVSPANPALKVYPTRTFTAVSDGTTTLTAYGASGAGFLDADEGALVSGTGIPAGTTITAGGVTPGVPSTAVLSVAPTKAGSFTLTITRATTDAPMRGVVSGDFNQDTYGYQDVVVATKTSILFYEGNGDGSFKPPVQKLSGFVDIRAIVTADFDGANGPDIAFTDAGTGAAGNGKVYVSLNDGSGVFAAPTNTPGFHQPYGLVAGDLDGGTPELVVTNYGSGKVDILKGPGFGINSTFSLLASDKPAGVAIGDFIGGDAIKDVAVAANGRVYDVAILKGAAGATFAATPAVMVNAGGPYPWSLAVGDLDADGDADLVVGNWQWPNGTTGSVYKLLQTGSATGTFTKGLLGAVVRPSSIAIGDLASDGNALPDVAVTSAYSRTLFMYRGTGAGNFTPFLNNTRGAKTTDVNPLGVVIADFDTTTDGWYDSDPGPGVIQTAIDKNELVTIGDTELKVFAADVVPTALISSVKVGATTTLRPALPAAWGTVNTGGVNAIMTVTMTGTGPYVLKWSDGITQTTSAKSITRTVNPASSTVYTVTVNGGSACGGSGDSVTIAP